VSIVYKSIILLFTCYFVVSQRDDGLIVNKRPYYAYVYIIIRYLGYDVVSKIRILLSKMLFLSSLLVVPPICNGPTVLQLSNTRVKYNRKYFIS